FLTGLDSAAQTTSLPTTDAEPEGIGKAMGVLVGGAAGASTGLALGSALASLFVPGVGPIMAAGIGAAAMLGLGGAVAGAKLGHESEDALDEGVPKDDIFLYRQLLKRVALSSSSKPKTTTRFRLPVQFSRRTAQRISMKADSFGKRLRQKNICGERRDLACETLADPTSYYCSVKNQMATCMGSECLL